MFSAIDPETQQLLAEMQEVKSILKELSQKFNTLETKIQRKLSSNFLKQQELSKMANDPAIQAEIAAIKEEFWVTETDGLDNS